MWPGTVHRYQALSCSQFSSLISYLVSSKNPPHYTHELRNEMDGIFGFSKGMEDGT